ncbi:helix-turn-helix domain-containing protein [Butyrivibrio sp. CB08]|uniref:helix-turn-helix domain-containing protein n=1 Tax=Butyrivibrio sp. CB08 TaxID=2364879 RepID=UPI000EA868AE|nr:helix-turn-helix transcriptional regulator [Butyrivibrio sp. CB08]RKM56896.1 helix-turn-helix domain-containing protein [Butyrivibrio sp. CB08]
MQLKLAEKIKNYRKEMELTQEGLAEAIGVTVGAVSKWENGNNVPDILTLMQLANFFNISMDELLGLELTSKNVDDMCAKVEELARDHEYEQAAIEVNNALTRFPNNFKVLLTCANLYYYKYMHWMEKKDSEKAISYYEMALDRIKQNTDPDISEYSIKGRIAYLYRETDPEKAIEHLKQINYGGTNNVSIAMILLDQGRVDEAFEYFSYAIIKSFTEQLNTVFYLGGAFSTVGKKAEIRKALEMLDVEIKFVEGSFIDGKVSYCHKTKALLYIVKACLYSRLGETEEMNKCVKKAYKLAREYDTACDVDDLNSSIKFLFTKSKIVTHDTTGKGAIDSIDNILQYRFRGNDGKIPRQIAAVKKAWDALKS